MNKKLITSLAVVLFLAFGSAQAGEWKSGAIAGFKKAWLYVPSSYAPRPAGAQKRSLVVHLMGCGQVIDQIKTSSGWEQAAEAYGMYVLIPAPNSPVFPNKQGPKVECFNYGYDTSGNFGAAVPTPNTPDHKLLIAAPGLLIKQYPDIDPNQVYAAGLSAGAAMAQQVACMAPDVYRGVGNAAGPGLNSRQAQAVAAVGGAGMVSAQPTQAAMQSQCSSWAGGKAAELKNQVWSIVSDNNFLPIGNAVQVSGTWTFDLFNDGSIWDGDKFTPTEYHGRAVGMLKALLFDNNAFDEEKEILLQSTDSTKGSGCSEAAANMTFTGLTSGTAGDAAPGKCLPKDAQRRHWKAEATHYRAKTGHIKLSRIEQDTMKHSWPTGLENTTKWLECIGMNGSTTITMDQIANKDNPKYSVLKDANGMWKSDVVATLANGAIGCIYFNSFSVNYPMYLAQLWNNNNPKLGDAVGNNKVPTLMVDAIANGFSVTVDGTALDEDGTIASLVISMTNKNTGTKYGPETVSVSGTGYYTYTFNGLTDGRHDITVTATDNEGEATVKTQGVAVGNIPNNAPVLDTFTAVSEAKGCISFSGKASDSDGTVNNVTISIIGRADISATLAGGNFTAKVCELPMGRTYSGSAVATDDLGAKSNEKSFSVLVPATTECESVTGKVMGDLENRTDLIETFIQYTLTYYRTTGDKQTVTRLNGPVYTIFIGNDGKGYLTDPKNCASQVEMFTVVASVNGTGGIITPATQQVSSGDVAGLLVTANAGKKIDSVTGCGGSLAGNTFTTAPVTADCSVVATFVDDVVGPKFYAVTLAVSGGNGTISPSGAQQVEEGKTLAFSVAPATNYKVKAVTGSTCNVMNTSGNNYTTSAVTSNCAVTATFELKPVGPTFYTVTLSAGANGSVSPNGAQSVQEGNVLSFKVTPASGYAVDKVQNSCNAIAVPDGSGNYTTAKVTGDCAVSFSFKKVVSTYTVTINAGANGSTAPTGVQSVTAGATVSFAVNPATGYKVQSVVGCGASPVSGNVYATAAVNADCTVNATFVKAESFVTVTLTAGANGTISPAGAQSVSKGSSLNFTINPAVDYTGSVAGSCGATKVSGNSYTIANASADCTVIASFVAVTKFYNVTLSAEANGAVNPAGVQSVAEGAELSFTVTPSEGYKVKAVTGCSAKQVIGSNYTTSAVNANCSVTATFEPAIEWRTVTLNAAANGSITPSGSQSVLEGSMLSFSVTPNGGFQVDEVTGSGCSFVNAGVNTYRTDTITSDCTVTATFKPLPVNPKYHTVTLIAVENGQITPAGVQQVLEGNPLGFTVVPNPGYNIDQVYGCDATSNVAGVYTTAPVLANCEIMATFKEIAEKTFEVTTSAGEGGKIAPEVVQNVIGGKELTFVVTANKDYIVKSIGGCGGTSPALDDKTTEVSYSTAGVYADCKVTATFSKKAVVAGGGGGGALSPVIALVLFPGLVLLRARRRRHAS